MATVSARRNGLLTSTALVPAITAFAAASMIVLPGVAQAQSIGGVGGEGGGSGGAGGASSLTQGGAGGAGGNGTAAGSGGGGGGSGNAGGSGGAGQGSGGGTGGSGSGSTSGQASNGGNATIDGSGGGGGAGGAGAYINLANQSITGTSFSVAAAAGGNGGAGLGSGAGGGGGAGGVANLIGSGSVVLRTTGSNLVVASSGGAGGNGGLTGNGGDGGDGGSRAITASSGTTTFFNRNTIVGGQGGNGGIGGAGAIDGAGGDGGAGQILFGAILFNEGSYTGGNGGTGSVAGSGGVGILGLNATIDNLGTISGGLSGDGLRRGLSLRLSGTSTITNIGTLVGGVEITSGTTTFDLATDQTLSNVVSGAGSLTKAGAGVLTLTGVNTYSGVTTVSAGTLIAANSNALGSTAGDTVVSSGATLRLQGGISIAELLTLNGAGVDGSGALHSISGTNELAGAITLASPSTIGSDAGSLSIRGEVSNGGHLLTVSGEGGASFFGAISGSGGFTKNGNGLTALFGNNTYSGGTTISAGTIGIGSNAALGTGTVVIDGPSTLAVLGSIQTVRNISNNFTIAADAVIDGTGGVGGPPFGFSGNVLELTGDLTGSGSLQVVRGGALTLGGNNAGFSGNLIIGGGTTADSARLRLLSSGATGTGTITLNRVAVLSNFSTDTLTLDNNIVVVGEGIEAPVLTSLNSAAGLILNGNISAIGAGDLIKAGASTVTLNGNNTFNRLFVQGGRVVAGSNTALGTGAVTTQTDTTLQLGTATSPGVSAGPITLANAINLQGNTLVNLVGTTGGVNSFTGDYVSTGTVATLGGVISGTGAMTVTGAGVLTLNGNNTYSGGTNVLQALVEVGHANAFGTGSVTLGTTAALRNNSGSALTLGNDIAVSGIAVTIGGTSNLTLTGNLSGTGVLSKVQGNMLAINGAVNDFSGGLTINGGTVLVNGTMGNQGAAVTVNNGGTLGGTGTIAGGVTVNSRGTLAAGQSPGTMTVGSLTLNTGSNTIFELAEAGVAGGANNDLVRVTGNLALNGGGISVDRGTGFSTGEYTLFEFSTLSGAIGNMTLNAIGGGFAGSLALGTNTVLLNVAGAADLVYWNGSTLAPAGSIVGGSGTWDLANGNFSNAAGTVSGPWAGNGALAIFGGTAGGGIVTIANDTVLLPSGIIFESNGYTITGGNAGSGLGLDGPTGIEAAAGVSATIAAPISGTGSITKNGDGTLVLTAGNSYAGGTNILAGTLQVGNGGTSGSLGSGNVLNNASLVFNRADDISFGGVISGSGTLVKQGAGNLVMSGANTYAGLTTVAAGTLTVTDDMALGTTAAGTMVSSGATLALDGSVTLAEAITLTGGGVGEDGALRSIGGFNQVNGLITLASAARINADSGLLTIAGGISGADHDVTFGGMAFTTILAPVTLGTGRIIKDGTSLLSLFSTNGETSELVINAGSVQVGFDGGPVNSALADSAGVTISDGTLVVGASETIGALAGSASAVVTDQGRVTTLTTGVNNSSSLFAGQLADTLSLTKVGSGTLVLTGANTYAGTTTITGGALQLGDGGTSGSIAAAAIINNGVLILSRSDAITLANAISGTGALVQAGTGSTRLTAANRYTGGTLVSAGRLMGDTAALQGAIQNNAVLEFAMPTNGTFAGALTGSGRVEKTGAGILTFAGDGRGVTGPFAVLGGTLRMDSANGGRLDRALVTLAQGTTLSGNGLIGGLVVESGALVTPGNSLGVIGVSGDVTFNAGSRFLAQITESGADLIIAGGAARLAGTLEVVNLGAAAYRFNTAFNVVEAAGGITGSFDTVTFAGFSPIYRPTLRSSAYGLAVVLAPASLISLAGSNLTGNQAAVAARFDAAVAGGFDPRDFLGVYSLAPAALAGVLDQLSGEVHPAMGRAAMRQSRLPREAVLERAASAGLAEPEQGDSFGSWAKLMRSWGDVAAAPGTAGQTTDTEGFVIGIDGGNANDARALRFGVYGSYLSTHVAIDARGSAGEIEQAGGGIYSSFAAGGFSLVAGAGAARFDITANRTVALPGLADSTASTSTGDVAQVFGRMGFRVALGAASLEPFVAADHAWISLDPVLERGGATALAAGRQDYKVAGATTGLGFMAQLGKLKLDAEGAARFELGDRAPEALIALATAPGAATRIGAPRLAGTAFVGRIGAVLPITARIEVRLGYTGEFSNTDTEHVAQAGLSIRF